MRNAPWAIAFGDYEFILDRRTLTFSLKETKTNTSWAQDLSLGWMDVENRETCEVVRHDFGAMKQVSVSEKAGPQGKRILFGLDCDGIPVDIYVICSQREIQLQIEASRDTRTHLVHGFGLLPGLCAVPDHPTCYLVVPHGEGAILFARDAPPKPRKLQIWDAVDGVNMPFVGAVRNGPIPLADGAPAAPSSALALITDSAYGSFHLSRTENTAVLNTEYERDPERRRLDLRIVLLPHGDHISIARTYREKIIGENNHVTLRKKMRETPKLEKLIGGIYYERDAGQMLRSASIDTLAAELKQLGVESGLILTTPTYLEGWTPEDRTNVAMAQLMGFMYGYIEYDDVRSIPSMMVDPPFTTHYGPRDPASPELIAEKTGADAILLWDSAMLPLSESDGRNRWEEMEHRQALSNSFRDVGYLLLYQGGSDWTVMFASIVYVSFVQVFHGGSAWKGVPLFAAVYRDATILASSGHLRLLINLATEKQWESHGMTTWSEHFERFRYVRRSYAVFGALHKRTFAAFLTAHRFLTPDFTVEEAIYSDKTRVVINQSDSNTYETEEFTLPPLGFYARHAQVEAHDALRLRETTFPTRAWRIRQSLDGKPLEQSADISVQEFPV